MTIPLGGHMACLVLLLIHPGELTTPGVQIPPGGPQQTPTCQTRRLSVMFQLVWAACLLPTQVQGCLAAVELESGVLHCCNRSDCGCSTTLYGSKLCVQK